VILVGKHQRMDLLWTANVDGRIILKFILEKYDVRVWTGFGWIRTVSNGRLIPSQYKQ
jgi:hypothetical protein